VFNLIAPSSFRGERDAQLRLEYRNDGQTDIPSPYFAITADNGKFRLPSQTGYSNGYIESSHQ